VLGRLEALGAHAAALAAALAVLGGDGELRSAAALAGLEVNAASRAAVALRKPGILATQSLSFSHPIVRTATLAGLAADERQGLHAKAAELLAAEGADPVDVGAHLLETEPDADPEVVARLRDAAGEAIARGVPDNAVAFLRRAEREPPTRDERAMVLFELGQAEVLDRDPLAREDLEMALSLATDPVEAGRISLLLAEALCFSGDTPAGVEVAKTAIDRLGDRDDELAARLEMLIGAFTVVDGRFVGGLDQRLPRLRAMAERRSPASRPLLLLLGTIAAMRTGRSAEVMPLIRRGLDGGRFVAEETADSLAAGLVLGALTLVDQPDELEQLLDQLQEDSRRRGSVMGHALASAYRGYTRLRRGRVGEALPDAGAALALTGEHELSFAAPIALAYWAGAMHEAGDSEPAKTQLDTISLGELARTVAGSTLLYTRGIIRLGLGRREEAADDLRRCGATQEAIRWRNPTMFPWRSALARAIAVGEPAEARALVDEELELAYASEQPRAIGQALHARALLEDPVDIEGLREAIAELERSPARLDLAYALIDLGAALRRANHRVEAREPLRRALDLGHRGGAVRAAERAREELVAAGGRPRRMAIEGTEALTPQEWRVARLAADGLSNPEIAQTLFVSRKAIEMHLSNAYRKLEIGSRDELPEALEPAEPTAAGDAAANAPGG
jgi:DNA-binding CsgD family transcriptional regulator